MEKRGADLVAEVLFVLLDPSPEIGEEEADARQFGRIRFLHRGGALEEAEFVARQTGVEFARDRFFLHRDRNLESGGLHVVGQHFGEGFEFLVGPAAQRFEIHASD